MAQTPTFKLHTSINEEFGALVLIEFLSNSNTFEETVIQVKTCESSMSPSKMITHVFVTMALTSAASTWITASIILP